MVHQRRDKRFRVSGEDDAGDIHAFETDDRDRAEAMKLVYSEDLQNVIFDRVRLKP